MKNRNYFWAVILDILCWIFFAQAMTTQLCGICKELLQSLLRIMLWAKSLSILSIEFWFDDLNVVKRTTGLSVILSASWNQCTLGAHHWSPISLVPHLIGSPSHWSPISLVPHLIGSPSHWSPISLVPHLIDPPISTHAPLISLVPHLIGPPDSLVPHLIGPPSHWSPSHWCPNS